MTRPYLPISCTVHDELLALATLRRECDLSFVDREGGPVTERSRIVDVYSSGGAEYLRLASGRVVRLDDLRALDGRPLSLATEP